MKIIILVRILWTAGRPKLAIHEAEELTRLGHEVEIIFLRKSERVSGYYDMLKTVNYKIVADRDNSIFIPVYDYITGHFMPDRKGDGRVDYNLIRLFPKLIRDKHVDLIICHDQWAGLSGYYTYKKYKVPYVVYIDERLSIFKGALGRIVTRLERKTLSNARRIFAITPKVAFSIKQKYGLDSVVDIQGLEVRNVVGYEHKDNFIISVTMWDAGRKPERYLDILSELPNYVLYMVGNWRTEDIRSKFISETKKRGMSERVLMKEGVNETELESLYERAKFAMRFGFGEHGSPSGITEALSHGLPIIMNEDLGNSFIVKENQCGLVMSDISTSEIKKFVQMTDNAESYHKLQENVLKTCKKYTWSVHAEKLLA